MSEEEKKAINIINSLGINMYGGKSQIISGTVTKEIRTAIYTILNLIEKQEKVIDEMAKWIEKNGYYTYGYANPTCDIVQDSCLNNHCLDRKSGDCQNCMKQYFYRKVENNE